MVTFSTNPTARIVKVTFRLSRGSTPDQLTNKFHLRIIIVSLSYGLLTYFPTWAISQGPISPSLFPCYVDQFTPRWPLPLCKLLKKTRLPSQPYPMNSTCCGQPMVAKCWLARDLSGQTSILFETFADYGYVVVLRKFDVVAFKEPLSQVEGLDESSKLTSW